MHRFIGIDEVAEIPVEAWDNLCKQTGQPKILLPQSLYESAKKLYAEKFPDIVFEDYYVVDLPMPKTVEVLYPGARGPGKSYFITNRGTIDMGTSPRIQMSRISLGAALLASFSGWGDKFDNAIDAVFSKAYASPHLSFGQRYGSNPARYNGGMLRGISVAGAKRLKAKRRNMKLHPNCNKAIHRSATRTK